MWGIVAVLVALAETVDLPPPLGGQIAGLWQDVETATLPPPAPEPVPGTATSLGPGSVDLKAMAALDSQMTDLRTLAAELEDEDVGAGMVGSVEPLECDLDLMTALLSQAINDAPQEAIARWSALMEAHPVAVLPPATDAEQCAATRTMMNLLDEAIMQGPCQPIQRALALARAVAQVPSELQPGFAHELSVLAQRQQDYRLLGRSPTDLCPDYTALELRLLSAF